MSLCRMWKVAFGRTYSRRIRLFAVINIAGFGYFTMMATLALYLGCWKIIPSTCDPWSLLYLCHYSLTLYLCINVIGNYLNIYRADSSVKMLYRSDIDFDSVKTFFCKKCSRKSPERCHHCNLCGTCILKRDHHCFFVTTCIGYHSEKYYTVFCLYVFLSAFYGTAMLARYLHLLYDIPPSRAFSMLDFLPECLWLWFTETRKTKQNTLKADAVFLLSLLYSCVAAGIAAGAFFYWQIGLVLKGQTTFESRRGIVTFSKASYSENYKEVFGPHWILSWILPLP